MLEQNIIDVNKKIETTCRELGLNRADITVIAASKTVDIETLNKLKQYNINICGENRVQEFLQKVDKVDTDWHFIGQLQTNKVKYIIDKVSLIHSLDRESLAKEIEKQCIKNNLQIEALIEVNVGGEASKGGVKLHDTIDFYKNLTANYKSIKIAGLMSVMPQQDIIDEKYYLQLKELYDTIKSVSDKNFRYLSVGMSDDYLIALKYGANMLRLGRTLFGDRN